MQFMPATWKAYGVDGNQDGLMDPYNPVDAIFAAARYLKAAGADNDIRAAVFAYNHADWYVDSVLLRAQVIGGLPSNLVGSLTGLTEGRFPVAAKATYADEVTKKSLRSKRRNPTVAVESSANRRGISIFADAGSPVVAVSDSRVVKIGVSERLGKLRPGPGRVRQHVHVRAPGEDLRALRRAEAAEGRPRRGQAHARAAQAGREAEGAASDTDRPAARAPRKELVEDAVRRGASRSPTAAPRRPSRSACSRTRRARTPSVAGGAQQEFLRTGRIDGALTPARALGLARDQIVIKQLKAGAQVPAGTVLGRIGKASSAKHPHLRFEIRPAGRGAPRIDPKPILDGWKLLESTAIYRAKGKNPFVGPDAATPTIGQILLMSKETLIQRVLADPRVQIYDCGRQRHPGRRDRPPRAGHARVPRRLRLQPDDHLAELRPLVPDRVGQRLRAHHRHAPWTSPPSTASRSSATRARARSPSSSSSAC